MHVRFALTFLIAATAVAQNKPGDWPMYNHDIGSTRYSALNQITAANVGKLSLAWTFTTRVPTPTTADKGQSRRPRTRLWLWDRRASSAYRDRQRDAYAGGKSGGGRRSRHGQRDLALSARRTPSRWEGPVSRPTPMPVGTEDVLQLGGKHNVALTATFAMADEDQQSLPLEVTNLQPLCFGGTKTG
jgi:hypothetical protein